MTSDASISFHCVEYVILSKLKKLKILWYLSVSTLIMIDQALFSFLYSTMYRIPYLVTSVFLARISCTQDLLISFVSPLVYLSSMANIPFR